MKRLIALSLFAFLVTNSYSQLTKGNWLVGGSGSFTEFKTMDLKEFYLQLSPNIGYFFFDKFAAGIKPSYTYDKITSSSSFGGTASGIYIGPFIRFYFLNPDKQFNLLLEGNYQHGFEKASDRYSSTNYDLNTFSFVGGPVVYFNSSVGLEFLCGYGQRKYTSDNFHQSRLVVNLGLQVHLDK